MTQPTTSSLPSSASKPSVLDHGLVHAALLVGIGVALAGVHQGWKLTLGLPGHYGLVWMAVVLWTRLWSRTPAAATAVALGYVGGILGFTGLGHHGLTTAPVYALCGLAVDGAWRALGTRLERPFIAGLVGGGAFMLKPLVMFAAAALLAVEVGSLRHGQVFPLLTHFGFGLTGAIIGCLAWRLAHSGDAAR